MDKDTMAKVNEVLKEKGFQELSLDDLDKVSGGSCYSIYDIKTDDDLYSFVYEYIKFIEDAKGRNVAAELLYSQVPNLEMKKGYLSGGCQWLYNWLGIAMVDNGGKLDLY